MHKQVKRWLSILVVIGVTGLFATFYARVGCYGYFEAGDAYRLPFIFVGILGVFVVLAIGFLVSLMEWKS